MTLQQLNGVIAIAETGSFSRGRSGCTSYSRP